MVLSDEQFRPIDELGRCLAPRSTYWSIPGFMHTSFRVTGVLSGVMFSRSARVSTGPVRNGEPSHEPLPLKGLESLRKAAVLQRQVLVLQLQALDSRGCKFEHLLRVVHDVIGASTRMVRCHMDSVRGRLVVHRRRPF